LATTQLTYSLSGIVRHIGLPVAGVTVCIYDVEDDRALVGLDRTTAKGEFFVNLPVGVYTLVAHPDSSTRYLPRRAEAFELSGNLVCNITLETGVVLRGRITGGGIEQERYRVKAVRTELPVFEADEHADASGEFALVLPKGNYYVGAYPEDAPEKIRIIPAGETGTLGTIFDTIQVDRDEQVLLAYPELVPFLGKVVDPAQKALSKCQVIVSPTTTGDTGFFPELRSTVQISCDKSGSFALAVQPGHYDFLVKPSGSELSEVLYTLNIQDASEHIFALMQGLLLSGSVKHEGQGVPGCRVIARPIGQGVETITITNDAGKFSFRLPSGEYEITVDTASVKNVSTTRPAPWSRIISIESDTEVNAELLPGHLVRFEVVDEEDEPIPLCKVTFGPYSKGETPIENGTTSGARFSQQNGVCQFILSGGVYSFQFQPPEQSSCQSKAIKQLSINADTHRRVKLPPKKNTGDKEQASSSVTQLWIQGT
jgi:hypothetical protein